MALGNRDILAALLKVKRNDSGIFNAIQYAAVVALRRKTRTLKKCWASTPAAANWPGNLARSALNSNPERTFYLWIPVPGHDLAGFTTALFEKAAVVVCRGTAYGNTEKASSGFPHRSRTTPGEAMERIKKAFGSRTFQKPATRNEQPATR